MKPDYIWSPGGRLANGTLAFALLAAGVLAILGPGEHEIVFLAAVPLVCIVAAIFAIGLSVRDHGGHALALVVVLPIAAGPYLGFLSIAPDLGLAVAVALLLPAIMLAGVSIAGERFLAPTLADHAGHTRAG
jgi:hypothetical protein